CSSRAPESVQIVVRHQPPARLGDRPRQRRVNGEGLRQVLDVIAVLHRQRDRQDQLPGDPSHHHTPDDHTGGRPAEGPHAASTQSGGGLGTFALGLVFRASMIVRAGTEPSSILDGGTPTAAISGRVNTAAATVRSRIGSSPSPSAWYIAMRPCIAATEARSIN